MGRPAFPYEQRFFPAGTQTTLLGKSVDMTPDGQWIVAGSGDASFGSAVYGVYLYKRDLSTGVVSFVQSLNTGTSTTQATEAVAISDDGKTIASVSASSGGVNVIKIFYRSSTSNLFSTPAFNQAEMSSSFGSYGSLAMSGDGRVIMVGAALEGKIYVYSAIPPLYTGWQKSTVYAPGLPYSNYMYSQSIDISDSLDGTNTYNFTIGAPNAPAMASSVVGGYVYRGVINATDPSNVSIYGLYTSGNYTAGGATNDKLGGLVSLSKNGKWMAAAATSTNNSTYVRVLEYADSLSSYYTRWTSPLDSNGMISGLDMSDDGSTIAIGKYNKNTFGTVEVYNNTVAAPNTWTLSKTITPTTSAQYGINFGWSVELSDNGRVLLVSAPGDDSADLNRQFGQPQYGSLYLYNL